MRCVIPSTFCRAAVIGGDLNMQNRNGVRAAQRFDYIAQLVFRSVFAFSIRIWQKHQRIEKWNFETRKDKEITTKNKR